MNDINSFFEDIYSSYALGFEPWNKLYRREKIEESHIRFDEQEKIGEDLLFNAMFYRDADSIEFVNHKLYHYNERSTSAMHEKGLSDPDYQMRLYGKIINWYGESLCESNRCHLFLMHFMAGINQVDKNCFTLKNCTKYIKNSFSAHHFRPKTWRIAIHNFCKSEQSSIVGKLRVRIEVFLARHKAYKLAAKLVLF